MGKIAIVTDSNSGITQDQAKKMGVHVIPMPFYINETLYLEGVTLTQEEFYERLKMMSRFPLPSQARQKYAVSGICF